METAIIYHRLIENIKLRNAYIRGQTGSLCNRGDAAGICCVDIENFSQQKHGIRVKEIGKIETYRKDRGLNSKL